MPKIKSKGKKSSSSSSSGSSGFSSRKMVMRMIWFSLIFIVTFSLYLLKPQNNDISRPSVNNDDRWEKVHLPRFGDGNKDEDESNKPQVVDFEEQPNPFDNTGVYIFEETPSKKDNPKPIIDITKDNPVNERKPEETLTISKNQQPVQPTQRQTIGDGILDNSKGTHEIANKPVVIDPLNNKEDDGALEEVPTSLPTEPPTPAPTQDSGVKCVTVPEKSQVDVKCDDGLVVVELSFVSYGSVEGECDILTLGTCHAPTSEAKVRNLCVGRTKCSFIPTNNMFGGDPCPGTKKSFGLKYKCGDKAALSQQNRGLMTMVKTVFLTDVQISVSYLKVSDTDSLLEFFMMLLIFKGRLSESEVSLLEWNNLWTANVEGVDMLFIIARSEKKKTSDLIIAPKIADVTLCLYETYKRIMTTARRASNFVIDNQILGVDHLTRSRSVGRIMFKWYRKTTDSPNVTFITYGTRPPPIPLDSLIGLKAKIASKIPVGMELENVFFSDGVKPDLKASLLSSFQKA